ncbi:MAG: D-aminoacyl-tRNA deacylase, partial [Solirubrobacteraceae bacterium]
YERFCDALECKRGVFGAVMSIEMVADGPVTLLVETPFRARERVLPTTET